MRFSVLGSGSSGNSIFIVGQNAKILIDSGFSFKQLNLKTALLGEELAGLNAVFVSHEHSDHAKGVGVLARKLNVPVFITPGTHDSLAESVGVIPNVEYFEAGDTIEINGLSISSFSLPHDASDPVGFTITGENAKLGIATDLGYAPHLVRNKLKNSNALILESNHCPNMLRSGPYPPQLQQRILSKMGHLSNAGMASLLSQLMHDQLRVVVLGHISADNNSPDHAMEFAKQVLKEHGAKLIYAEQHVPTPMLEV